MNPFVPRLPHLLWLPAIAACLAATTAGHAGNPATAECLSAE